MPPNTVPREFPGGFLFLKLEETFNGQDDRRPCQKLPAHQREPVGLTKTELPSDSVIGGIMTHTTNTQQKPIDHQAAHQAVLDCVLKAAQVPTAHSIYLRKSGDQSSFEVQYFTGKGKIDPVLHTVDTGIGPDDIDSETLDELLDSHDISHGTLERETTVEAICRTYDRHGCFMNANTYYVDVPQSVMEQSDKDIYEYILDEISDEMDDWCDESCGEVSWSLADWNEI